MGGPLGVAEEAARVEVRGDVTFSEDPGELVVRLHPTKVIAYGGMTG
ncbi:hypothetical protein [Actinomadura rudentiformis]|nr:hypothetical protein [Actinomadura rudentiformis]